MRPVIIHLIGTHHGRLACIRAKGDSFATLQLQNERYADIHRNPVPIVLLHFRAQANQRYDIRDTTITRGTDGGRSVRAAHAVRTDASAPQPA